MEISGKGVCRLSIVPVRKEPGEQSEMITQLLFGDHYEILDSAKDNKWLFITVGFDGYQGWIDAKQNHFITEDYFQQILSSEFRICTDILS
jgi:hypothetical protein